MLGGLEWSGLAIVCDVLGIDDPELLIAQLVALRNNQDKLGTGDGG